jgi:hypothetical protein
MFPPSFLAYRRWRIRYAASASIEIFGDPSERGSEITAWNRIARRRAEEEGAEALFPLRATTK